MGLMMNLSQVFRAGLALISFPAVSADLPVGDDQARHPNCANISGDFAFVGVRTRSGSDEPTTFLRVAVQRSRKDVEWFRIEIDAGDSARMRVTLFAANSNTVGEPIVLLGTCNGTTWEQYTRQAGSGDGTLTKAESTWRYSVDGGGTLIISTHVIGADSYLPGIRSQFEASSVSKFARRAAN